MVGPAQFSMIYDALQIYGALRDEIEEIRLTAPARRTGTHSILSHAPELFSKTNAAVRSLESDSAELTFGLECELDPTVIWYCCQPSLKNIIRNGKANSTTADFLVYRENAITVVECKHDEHLQSLSSKKPDEWLLRERRWHRPPVEAWAKSKKLKYQIWCPPKPHAIYLANLKLLYERSSRSAKGFAAPLQTLTKRLARGALTIEEALHSISGLRAEGVIWAIAKRLLHGTVVSVPLDDLESFRLYLTAEQANEADQVLLARLGTCLEKAVLDNPILNSTPVDYARGCRRLEHVNEIIEGNTKPSPYWKRLCNKVAQAKANGESPLAACLTNLHRSGRRTPQLTGKQSAIMQCYVERFLRTNELVDMKQAHRAMVIECNAQDVRPPSYQAMRQAIQSGDTLHREIVVSGKRGFHRSRPAIDPTHRRLPAMTFGHTAHIDSTSLDVRCIANLDQFEVKDRPILYIACDEATGLPLGRALLFGRACRDHLAVLMRDIVARNGFLPSYIVADRGCEYTSHWFREFRQATGITWQKYAASAPRNNSEAENLLGRINRAVPRMLIGSTEPDRADRNVDGRFKSYTTARHSFNLVVEEIDALLFSDFPRTPLGIRAGSPDEQREHLVSVFGSSGIPTSYDDNFVVLTSIPLPAIPAISPVAGIRHLNRNYSSAELLASIRTGKPTEVRRDCVNPARLYVRFRDRWVTAFSSDVVRIELLGETEKLFETLVRPYLASANRLRREAIAQLRTDRIALANASSASLEQTSSRSPAEPDASQGEPWVPTGQLFHPYL